MSNILKYIIIVGHLSNAFVEENEETIKCMNSILVHFMTKDNTTDDVHLNNLVVNYGRNNVERALNCLSDMYKKIT